MERQAEPLASAQTPEGLSSSHGAPPARGSRPATRLFDRIEAWLQDAGKWLRLALDGVLVAIAALLLVMGAVVLLGGAADLIGHVTLRLNAESGLELQVSDSRAVVDVVENALLALILAELVGTLLLTLGGRELTVHPFIIIAIVAVVRHLLFLTVKENPDPIVHTVELLGLGGLILLLVGALVLLSRRPADGRGQAQVSAE